MDALHFLPSVILLYRYYYYYYSRRRRFFFFFFFRGRDGLVCDEGWEGSYGRPVGGDGRGVLGFEFGWGVDGLIE